MRLNLSTKLFEFYYYPLEMKKRGAWSKDEDTRLLLETITKDSNWKVIAARVRTRNVKQCRERFLHIDPKLSKEPVNDREFVQFRALRNQGRSYAEISNIMNKSYGVIRQAGRMRTITMVGIEANEEQLFQNILNLEDDFEEFQSRDIVADLFNIDR